MNRDDVCHFARKANAAGASEEVAEAIRAEVEALLDEDPTLQALLTP